eukprot:6492787-Amphidinium_carterae.1
MVIGITDIDEQVLKDWLPMPRFDLDVTEDHSADAQVYLLKSAQREKVASKTYARTASWHWLVALDNMLVQCTARGLSRFQDTAYSRKTLPKTFGVRAGSPVFLSVVGDQAAPQMSPMNYAMYECGLCAFLLHDPNHRAANDLVNAMKHTRGMMSMVKCKALAWNVFYGPFASAGHWKKSQSAAAAFAEAAGPSDPIFLYWLSECAKDRGEEERLTDPSYSGELWSQTVRMLTNMPKKSKFQLTRWGSFWDCWEEWEPLRAMRCMALTFMGMSNGWVVKREKCVLPKLVKSAASTSDERKATMQSEQEEQMRKDHSDEREKFSSESRKR